MGDEALVGDFRSGERDPEWEEEGREDLPGDDATDLGDRLVWFVSRGLSTGESSPIIVCFCCQ